MANDINIIRGTSKTLKISVTDTGGEPLTIPSGGRLIFGVKEKANDENLVITKVVTEITDGVALVELDPPDTINLKVQRYLYDVGLQIDADYYNIIKASPFMVEQNITKWGDGV